MRTALATEWLKLRRSPVMHTATAVLVFFAPLLSAAFLAASGVATGSPRDTQLAAKVSGMVIGTGWDAYLGLIAQTLSVASLLVVGIAVAWCVGREFTDRTVGSLMALPVSRTAIIGAKLVLMVAWATGACVAAVLVALVAGPVIGLGMPSAGVTLAALKTLTVGVLGALLALPVAAVAVIGRGHLPAVAALLGIVVVTQIVTSVGVGGWFPYTAPSLWAGMGGAAAAAAIGPAQLALVLPVAVGGAWATVAAWRRLQLA